MKLTIPRGATAMSPIPVGIRSDGAGGKLIVFRPEGGVHRLVSGMNGSGKTYGELPVLVTLGALQVDQIVMDPVQGVQSYATVAGVLQRRQAPDA